MWAVLSVGHVTRETGAKKNQICRLLQLVYWTLSLFSHVMKRYVWILASLFQPTLKTLGCLLMKNYSRWVFIFCKDSKAKKKPLF